MVLWIFEEYYLYSAAIVIMAVISAVTSIVETRRNLLNVRRMAMYVCPVRVLRGKSDFLDANSPELVPGDILEIPEARRMPCDCVMLSGAAVVNEAMLTGESNAVLKTCIVATGDTYDPEEHKKHTIFAGTEVMQTRRTEDRPVLGLVTRTGFGTIKGSLIRYILFPRPSEFSLYTDSYKFIAVMFCMSVVGVVAQIFSGATPDAGTMLMKCLDLITITVPPALPACMSIGIAFALSRLKGAHIFCISPPRINVAGRVGVVCFDKTGTLTEEGLSVYGFRVAAMRSESEATFCTFRGAVAELLRSEKVEEGAKSRFVECMASCHAITKANEKFIGDPLDIEMFESTGWALEETGDKTYVSSGASERQPRKLWIVRRFDFSSRLQRMSVLVHDGNLVRLFAKGSPEKIAELSRPETLPLNFSQILLMYTQRGCRVLALASRDLNIELEQCGTVKRELAERRLRFLGLLILQNRLKPATEGVIRELTQADIRTIMVTGDNACTAINVAQECSMIPKDVRVYLGDLKQGRVEWEWMRTSKEREAGVVAEDEDPTEELRPLSGCFAESPPEECVLRKVSDLGESVPAGSEAEKGSDANSELSVKSGNGGLPWETAETGYALAITGRAFDLLLSKDPEFGSPANKAVLERTRVFARMSPEGKARLVEVLQKRGCLVGMCGDGANDCVALKTANVGISLSEAEASIAAPFTSQVQDISCVVSVLREGRAALTTSFQCFKYMALYSMIQFASVTLMYTLNRSLTDMQFLMVDLVMIIPVAVTMSRTEAATQLSKSLPESDLLSFPVLASIVGQVLIQIVFQVEHINKL